MATPHLTGALALYLEAHPAATPAQARYAIVGTASGHAVLNPGRLSPDGLLYTGFFGSSAGNLPPLATFDFSCTALSCSFNRAGSLDDQGIVSRAWTFGDGSSGSCNQAPHAYSTAGTFSVTLRVADARGLSATLARSFTLPAAGGRAGLPPTAAMTAFPHGPVDFDGSPSIDDVGIGSWQWDFGDGTIGSGKTITHSYANPNQFYTVRLTVFDLAGQSASVQLVVFPNSA